MQNWPITFTYQICNVRVTKNCSVDSDDFCSGQSLVSTTNFFRTTLTWMIVVDDWQLNDTNKKLSFSFVSRCSHVWCRSRRFDWILLVLFRRWGRLVMRDLIKHDALLWLVVFQQLWFVHFDPCCSLSDLLPRRSSVARLSCCCVSWSWASTLLEFLFHYPCWCC